METLEKLSIGYYVMYWISILKISAIFNFKRLYSFEICWIIILTQINIDLRLNFYKHYKKQIVWNIIFESEFSIENFSLSLNESNFINYSHQTITGQILLSTKENVMLFLMG